ncbi:MAG: enoyl-CoA hydratase/isomerase family protein [Candidatus Rokubacteria bacterium]|nr:enoyl-CoA hydratase/isomerase family protein [Candidatus Rokubacteria bacterium]MBI3105739.1 enoyl-CoA hydratase/isomerase family protein [Candidatus Rokubacteria bacterium]
MAEPQVLLGVEGHIAILTLNRPEAMNAMGHDLARDLEAALDRLEAAHEVRAVVATGAGDRAFSVGGDIKERGAMSLDERWEHALRLGRCFHRLEALPVPVIAAINGFCFGGGMEMAVACDLRIASERAEVGFLEVKLGVFPGAGGPARLTRLVGKGRAKLVLYTGRRFPAAEALATGLVERVVPRDRLMAEARALAAEIAANGPLAVRALKRLVDTCYEADLAASQELARALRRPLDHTADMLEGVRAFEEKRPPRFQGR